MENLALRYRPRSLDDLVGQRAVQVVLAQMLATRTVPPAMLFHGVRGTGKTTSARVVAAALNCEARPGPCQTCPSCKAVYDGTSPDVIEIDAASNGLVDDIRDLRHQLLYRVAGDHRIVILDEAHSASAAAFNALLKPIEEPPPGAVFILCTTEKRRIPDTILSRAMPFHFRRIAPATIAARLAAICDRENIPAGDGFLDAIAARADGGMRDAIMTLDQVSRVGARTGADVDLLLGHRDHATPILTALAAADLKDAYRVLDEALHTTGDPATILADMIHQLARTSVGNGDLDLEPRQSVDAMRVLWELKTKTRIGDDARANLELAITMIGEVLCATPAKAAPTPPARLTLDDLKRHR